MKIVNTKKYLALYNQEDYLFNFLGPQIRKRGYLTFEEFYKICMWKSVRPKQRYLKNKETIQAITTEAFLEKDELKKMEKLCTLKGVAIPTASAILTIVYPDRYAIIDIRCLEMLQELKFPLKKIMSLNNWFKYLAIARELADENNLTPRQIDKVLFSMHRELLEQKNYKNLYHIKKAN